MSLNDDAAERILGAYSAVVRALRAWVAALGPAQGRLLVLVEQGVLLLEAEPRDLVQLLVEDGVGWRAGVGRDGLHVGGQAVAQHQDVGCTAERIREDGARAQQHLGVVAGGLAGGGTCRANAQARLR